MPASLSTPRVPQMLTPTCRGRRAYHDVPHKTSTTYPKRASRQRRDGPDGDTSRAAPAIAPAAAEARGFAAADGGSGSGRSATCTADGPRSHAPPPAARPPPAPARRRAMPPRRREKPAASPWARPQAKPEDRQGLREWYKLASPESTSKEADEDCASFNGDAKPKSRKQSPGMQAARSAET